MTRRALGNIRNIFPGEGNLAGAENNFPIGAHLAIIVSVSLSYPGVPNMPIQIGRLRDNPAFFSNVQIGAGWPAQLLPIPGNWIVVGQPGQNRPIVRRVS